MFYLLIEIINLEITIAFIYSTFVCVYACVYAVHCTVYTYMHVYAFVCVSTYVYVRVCVGVIDPMFVDLGLEFKNEYSISYRKYEEVSYRIDRC